MTTPNISEAARETTLLEIDNTPPFPRFTPTDTHVQRLLDSTQAANVAEIERLRADLETALSMTPVSTNRTRGEAHEMLGEVSRHVTNEKLQSSHGCVEVTNAQRVVDTLIGDITALRTRAESAEKERDFLKSEWEKDSPLPEDEEISMAHPVTTGNHEAYQEAMRFVGARHSKSGLVELVNWLLVNCSRLIQERANLDFQPTRKGGDEPCETPHAPKEAKDSASDAPIRIAQSTEEQPVSSNAASPGPIPADAATPRTDKAKWSPSGLREVQVVRADLAQALERELTAERAARLKAEASLESIKAERLKG